jgi:hypothetical protein
MILRDSVSGENDKRHHKPRKQRIYVIRVRNAHLLQPPTQSEEIFFNPATNGTDNWS